VSWIEESSVPTPRGEFTSAVVLGGNGAMGSLFCGSLVGRVERVTVMDLAPDTRPGTAATAYHRADVLALDAEARRILSTADVVILTLPESVAIESVHAVRSAMRGDALLVDTLSVKTQIVGLMREFEPPLETLSINPMFGPSAGFAGQNLIAVKVAAGPRAERFIGILQTLGCRIAFRTAEEHDRAMAALQSATHAAILAFGMALEKLDYDVKALADMSSPPHRVLLALVARILGGEPEVYWDIQAHNSFAQGARDAVRQSAQDLSDMVASGGEAEFRARLDRLRTLLGPDLAFLARKCSALFDTDRQIEKTRST
jgi:prephenate dehydrogenase